MGFFGEMNVVVASVLANLVAIGLLPQRRIVPMSKSTRTTFAIRSRYGRGDSCAKSQVYFRKSGETATSNETCFSTRPTSRDALIGAGSF